MSIKDEKFMEMALRLARRGISSVEPNPAVGAIIIKANQIIGRGWHRAITPAGPGNLSGDQYSNC